MGIAAAVQAGIGTKAALSVWGAVVERRGLYPEGFGWPSVSVEWRAMKGGSRSSGTSLTGPEQAVENLEEDRAIAQWVHSILEKAPETHRQYALLRHARGKTWEAIAEALQLKKDSVQAMDVAVRMRIGRALKMMRQT